MAELKVIWILAIGLGLACTLGYAAQRVRLSPVLGYLLAGYFIGPNFPGYVADLYISDQLATIGVTLLMFAIGLNFNWKDLLAVRKLALPGALTLSFLSIVMGLLYTVYLGESIQAGFVVGLAICVSSTVVIVRVLTDQHLLHTRQGHIVVGWTIVEDLVSVVGLILLPALVGHSGSGDSVANIAYSLLIVALKMGVLAFIIYFFGEKLIKHTLLAIARTKSQELFTLAILSSVFFIAAGSSYLFGVSLALGAFIAGTVVGRTDVSHQAAANALPMRDAFAVVFFLSVGMLFDPIAVGNNFPLFLGILVILLCLRPILAFFLIKLVKYPNYIAFTVAIAIGQIGEYSFILAEEGSQLNILPDNAYDILVACAFISIALNPIFFQLFKPLITKKKAHSLEFTSEEERDKNAVRPQAVIIGYDKVGDSAVNYLLKKNYQVVIIDENIDTVSDLKKQGSIQAIFGDATQPQILENAKLENAGLVIVNASNSKRAQSIVQVIQKMYPHIKAIVRFQSKLDADHFKLEGIPIIDDEDLSSEKMIAVIRSSLSYR